MEVKNICVGRKYTDKQGEEKTQWNTIGKFFVNDEGKQSIVLDMIPTNWDGRAMIFEQKKENVGDGSGKERRQTATQTEVPF